MFVLLYILFYKLFIILKKETKEYLFKFTIEILLIFSRAVLTYLEINLNFI